MLDKQVLERLIIERALLQYAKETGIRVDDTTVERTILRVAEENKLTPDEFRKVLEREGIAYANVSRGHPPRRSSSSASASARSTARSPCPTPRSTTISRRSPRSRAARTNTSSSHIYVTVPEQATPDVVDARRKRAETALAQINSGKDFAEVAASYSDAPDASSGGNLGWRTPARLPRCSRTSCAR